MLRSFLILSFVLPALVLTCAAQEAPYFVTYDHHMEEPGNAEVEVMSTAGLPRDGAPAYIAPWMEVEYGVKGWWTSEFYLEGQHTRADSTIFTGWRVENRFRLLAREHAVNPVLYLEYENINEASRIQKEVMGHASGDDGFETNAVLRSEIAREIEGKLILSSHVHDWNISENFMFEKNLSSAEPFEFGYSVGVARPLSRMVSANECRFCRENFIAGVEAYGGLGDVEAFGFRKTAQYVAPVIAWRVAESATLKFSPAFGITDGAARSLIRFGYSYEFSGVRDGIKRLFARKKAE